MEGVKCCILFVATIDNRPFRSPRDSSLINQMEQAESNFICSRRSDPSSRTFPPPPFQLPPELPPENSSFRGEIVRWIGRRPKLLYSKETCTRSVNDEHKGVGFLLLPSSFANAKCKCANEYPAADIIPRTNLVIRDPSPPAFKHYSAKEGREEIRSSEFHSRGYTVPILSSPFIPDFRSARGRLESSREGDRLRR